THVGMVMLFDAVEGLPLAMLEGASLTAIRTSAASALATDALARPESARLAILGCGEQARRHVKAMQAVRQIEEIVVWGRSPEKAAAFAGELAQEGVARARSAVTVADAVSDADIVCATTSAKEPILFGADLPEGVHVNLVGSAIPTTAEADEDLVARSRFFVDYRTATLAAAGEFLRARDAGRVSDAHILAEIGEVLAGQAEGRTTPDDITVYKSLGVSAQDLAAGELVYKRAQDAGVGVQVDLTD
ncbi:MAG: ornithine cyclodeaminase family protein, partial [Pseudomonadota bacterium]